MIDPDLGGGAPGRERLEIAFDTPAEGTGLVVTDQIERHQCRLWTPEAVTPEPADPARLRFPTDADGEMLAQAEHFSHEEFPPATYSLELCGSVKIYLRVESGVTVSSDAMQTSIEFDAPTAVLVGARSHHERPAATITTTDDPREMMVGVSAFGSALKTTSPERSYPTLRGHPPLLELGDHTHVPRGLESPDTGVTIELPADYRHLYVAAPLAYYLGAEVVEGDDPLLVTDRGFEHGLDSLAGFEREVERVLKQTFFFDCLTRTEGYYKVSLHEREAIEPKIDFDFADLYERSLAEQLETYLSVPYTTVESLLPEWKLTTHVEPTAENAELLPFVTNDLSIVRTPRGASVSSSEVQATAAGEFFRDGFTRGAAAEPARSYVQPEASESIEQAWVGDGTPIGASKTTPQAYRNRLARPPADGDIDITVVCNDPKMLRERDIVEEVYGSREELPFDVRMYYDLTVEEFSSILTTETDFLHYIGHIDHEGFQCADGKLDATTFEDVGMDSFLLNACQSYEQGETLVDAGAIGGIVTITEVINSGAVEMGGTLARLLNRGFSLRSALRVASGDSVIGNQYGVVGDGGFAITQPEGGFPNVCIVHGAGDGFELEYKTFTTSEIGIGSLVIPHIQENHRHYLSSGVADRFELSREELEQFLSLEETPVIVNNELYWSDSLTVDGIVDLVGE
ncbi:MAG: hypothetical protein ABEJ28_09520 [Salinigranum sp.]